MSGEIQWRSILKSYFREYKPIPLSFRGLFDPEFCDHVQQKFEHSEVFEEWFEGISFDSNVHAIWFPKAYSPICWAER